MSARTHNQPPARPPTERTSTLELAALPSAIPLARQHTKTMLAMWSVPPGVIETAELLTSELTTNALPKKRIEHPAPTWGEMDGLALFELRLRQQRARLFIEVKDANPRPPVRKQATDDDESGRGLFLVAAMSVDWGYYYETAPEGMPSHKVVWCELSCIESAPATSSAATEAAAEVTCELPAVIDQPTILPDSHYSMALRFSPNA